MKVLAALMFLLIWTTVVAAILIKTNTSTIQLAGLLNPIGLKANIADLTAGSTAQAMTPRMLFFRACIVAPTWEELEFRVLPIGLAVLLLWLAIMLTQILLRLPKPSENTEPTAASAAIMPPDFLWVTCFASSIIFGLMHGSVMNLPIQGVAGLVFSWLYIKTNYSYLSVVAAHSIWNIMLIFGLRILLLLS